MADIANFPNRRRPGPFEVFYPINWQGREPAPVEWIVKGCIPRRSVVLFSGDSGLGKSLAMQQLQTACATGRGWLGFEVTPCRSFGMYCEDPLEPVLQWRQRHICKHYGVEEQDLDDMSMVSRIGCENSLMDFNRKTDMGVPTPLYDQIRSHVEQFGCQLVIIDTLAQVFNGLEIARTQVTSFISILHKIAKEMDGAVILTSHPSNTGLSDGRGTSGSTAWRASVRCHMYLKRPKGYDEEDENASDERVLKTMKSNWGPSLGVVKLKWEDGVFVRQEQLGPGSSILDRLETDARIMLALRHLIQTEKVSPSNHGANSFIALLQSLPECKSYMRGTLIAWRDRMMRDGKLVIINVKGASLLRPADARYAIEEPKK